MPQPKKRKRVEQPAVRRQAILDQLNNRGHQSARQLSEALQYEQRTVSTYLREMKGAKEVRVAEERLCSTGVVPFYEALVTTTHATMMMSDDGQKTRVNVTREIRPGHTQHLGTQRNRPLQNAGGQGRCAGGFGVASTLGGGPLFVKL